MLRDAKSKTPNVPAGPMVQFLPRACLPSVEMTTLEPIRVCTSFGHHLLTSGLGQVGQKEGNEHGVEQWTSGVIEFHDGHEGEEEGGVHGIGVAGINGLHKLDAENSGKFMTYISSDCI